MTGTTRLVGNPIAMPTLTSLLTWMPLAGSVARRNFAFISGNAASDSTTARMKNGSSVSL